MATYQAFCQGRGQRVTRLGTRNSGAAAGVASDLGVRAIVTVWRDVHGKDVFEIYLEGHSYPSPDHALSGRWSVCRVVLEPGDRPANERISITPVVREILE